MNLSSKICKRGIFEILIGILIGDGSHTEILLYNLSTIFQLDFV